MPGPLSEGKDIEYSVVKEQVRFGLGRGRRENGDGLTPNYRIAWRVKFSG